MVRTRKSVQKSAAKAAENIEMNAPYSPLEANETSPDAPESHEMINPAEYHRKLAAEIEKREMLEDRLEYVLTESRFRLEATFEDIKKDFTSKLDKISSELQVLHTTGKHIAKSKFKSNRKVFFPQESLLSRMLHYNDENYKTIFNISLVVMILWGLSLAFDDVNKSGLPNFDLLLWGIFRDLGPFTRAWFKMAAASFLVVPLAHITAEAPPRSLLFYFLCLVYAVFQVVAYLFSAAVVSSSSSSSFAMPLAMGFMAEQSRISMKMHSYFREKVLWERFKEQYACRPISTGSCCGLATPSIDYIFNEMSKFLSFLFFPTLVYRDNYPRTSRIRWDFVLLRTLEAIGIVYYAFLVFRVTLPAIQETAGTYLPLKVFTKLTFSSMGPAMASMFFTHFLVLHVVQNIFAELTRFADRQFYQDWWNSRTFSVFYRKWNGVVHDFIHAYLYTDLVELAGLPKTVSLLASFFISAIIHEYVICVSMGYFLPVLGILFTGPGLIFILLTKNKTGRVWNIFLWLMLGIGNGWLLVIYAREYYSRVLLGEEYFPDQNGLLKWYFSEKFFMPVTFKMQFPELAEMF